MDRFVDMQHVRLRNRVLDKYYLCADDDGRAFHQPAPQLAQRGVEGAHLPRRRRPASAPPQRRLRPLPLRHGHARTALPPRLPRQAARLRPAGGAVHHVAGRQAGLGGGILLENGGVRYLRANGKYLRWNTGVTVENRDIEKVSAMMRWTVEPILLRERPPAFQARFGFLIASTRLPDDLSVTVFRRQPGAWQVIRFVQANPDGWFPEAHQDWSAFHFRGRSLYHLRDELARQVKQQPDGIAMCVRAGRYGRPTPLVVNLPRGGWGDTLQIIAASGTPGFVGLHGHDNFVGLLIFLCLKDSLLRLLCL
ncbi:hypothetical protein ZWY2020_029111 [Hordeum vulgare]|nr:hypothetical protein ZWY2020_029111 [Hordeum vulgare]